MTREAILMTLKEYQSVGGHSIVINNLCTGLNKIGYNVVIGAFSINGKPPDGIEIVKLNRFGDLTNIGNGYRFDLIHNHQPSLNYYSILTKKPFLFHYHGAMGKIQEINLNFSLNLCQNHISKIISVAYSALSKIPKNIQYKIPNEVVYNGVDTNLFNPNFTSPIPKGEPQLIFVGNLFKYKNVIKIINLMPSIIKSYPKVHLQVVGEGDEYSNLNREVISKQLTNHVSLLGKISSLEELRNRYLSSDIYISASTIEASPLPPLEAMACGVPLLLFNIPAHRELIEKSKAGLTFSLANSDLQIKIKEVYENRKNFGDSARKFAKESDWTKVCKKISQVYEKILNN